MERELSHWIEVDLDAVVANLHTVREKIGQDVKVIAVVKADAYGLGAVAVSRALAAAGVEMLAVTTLEEGIELVEHGIATPILVFAPLLPGQSHLFIKYSLIPTVDRLESLCDLAEAAKAAKAGGNFNRSVPVHLKVETGMGRNGVLPAELPAFLAALKNFPEIEMAGIYSHLATAMHPRKTAALKQLEIFRQAVALVRGAGFRPVAHLANSAAILHLPESHLEMVRTGTLLYGQHPAAHFQKLITLQNPWQAKARIVAVKTLPAGAGVGYGQDFIAAKTVTVAVVAIGFADGYGVEPQTRPVKLVDFIKNTGRQLARLSGRVPTNTVNWQGKVLPVLGRIGMQLSMVDARDCPVQVGDEVTISLRRVTASSRLPRIYRQSGQVVGWREINGQITSSAGSDKKNLPNPSI